MFFMLTNVFETDSPRYMSNIIAYVIMRCCECKCKFD